eukprot:m.21888 g.21888  ORF g.21888 m.21888 type:complete len:552 (+) comp3681_c0_seq2:358-2013(+)
MRDCTSVLHLPVIFAELLCALLVLHFGDPLTITFTAAATATTATTATPAPAPTAPAAVAADHANAQVRYVPKAPTKLIKMKGGGTKQKTISASDLSKSKSLQPLVLGFLGETLTFVPHGTVRTSLYDACGQYTDGDAAVIKMASALFEASVPRSHMSSTPENQIDALQRDLFCSVLPRPMSVVFQQPVPHPYLGISNVIDLAATVDIFGTSFSVYVGKIKESKADVIEGLPQALLAGASAAVQLRTFGVPLSDCVIPILVSTGNRELHGAVYLLEPNLPVFVATTPALDILVHRDRLVAAKHRLCEASFAMQTAQRLDVLGKQGRSTSASKKRPGLNLSLYFIKPVTSLPDMPWLFDEALSPNDTAASSSHELMIFERLATRSVKAVEYPVARLTHIPRKSWRTGLCTVYANLEEQGYVNGFPHTDAEAWIDKVEAAVAELHRADVVHADLFPCNIMARWDGDKCVDVKLIDFAASLLVGEPVPKMAAWLINYNDFKPMYHPHFAAKHTASTAICGLLPPSACRSRAASMLWSCGLARQAMTHQPARRIIP